MNECIIYMIVFSVLYAVKGGQHKYIPGVSALRKNSKIMDRFLDGKVVSTAGVFALGLWDMNFAYGVMLGLAWLIAVSPSMGEEVGGTGGYRGAWGPYIDRGFGRGYAVKKCIQRGVFAGAK